VPIYELIQEKWW